MALVSPGIEVTIVDESNYIPAATNSVPYILIATAQNKLSGTGTGVAAGTLAANANKIYLITSQRDLAQTFGNPFFYKTSNGTPINGYEINEYGLLAAYSVLGISNRAYVQRVDVDLAALTASLSRPTGAPDQGTWWFDTASSRYGIFEWNQATSAFVNKIPLVITNTDDLIGGVPKESVGAIGDYAVVATNVTNPVYYKNTDNAWVLVGSEDWQTSWPAVQASESSPVLTIGNSIYINDTLVTATGTTVASFAADINSAGIDGVTAAAVNNKLEIYGDYTATNDGSTPLGLIEITNNSGTLLTALGITAGIYYVPFLQQSPHTQVPRWRSTDPQPRPTGSIWHKTTSVNLGTLLSINRYDAVLGTFSQVAAPLYPDDLSANKALDPSGGGKNIPPGSVYTQYGVVEINGQETETTQFFERVASGSTIVIGDNTAPTFTNGESFTISVSTANSTEYTTPVTATLAGTTAADFVTAFSAANAPYTVATVLNTGAIQLTHTQGGVIALTDVSGTPVADAGFNTSVQGCRDSDGSLILSNWIALGGENGYVASADEPSQDPANGTPWYYSATNVADIMINDGTGWKGYRTVSNDVRGYNLVNTDPNGPIFSASAPTEQSDGTALVLGDLWIDTSDLENYPKLYRYQSIEAVEQWVLIDNADATTENGILFADARWAPNGTTDPITGDFPTITSLLVSSYLDIDAPDYTLYPAGTLLFNTRRSGFNVKEFRVNYFNGTDFPDDSLPTEKNAWVTISGNRDNGSPYMGRSAQRQIIVQALKAGIDTNEEIREEQRQFNLIACPGYPELVPNMVNLNNDRNNTAFVIGDTPLRLPATGTDILAYVTDTSANGISVNDPYVGYFYPSCQTTDLTGSTVVTYPSHMMLRTFVRNDEVAFPWLAPAGTRRGTVDNAFALGYVNAQTGEFVQVAVNQGLRDTLYENDINPITFIPGSGIANYGNKTKYNIDSALDRINVARLIAFVRGRLEAISNNFLFEPNDQITRDEIKNAIEGLMNDLVAKRGIYDYLVVCDDSNNTPARIDRNELYVDIAIEPVKAVEFIYIPVRIKNTGEISAGNVASAQAVA